MASPIKLERLLKYNRIIEILELEALRAKDIASQQNVA